MGNWRRLEFCGACSTAFAGKPCSYMTASDTNLAYDKNL